MTASADPERLAALAAARAIVVKVGTRVLTDAQGRLDQRRIAVLSRQLCELADSGRQTVLVSSGAVGAGIGKLGLGQRPRGLALLQAVAAVGQADLIRAYDEAFSSHGRHAAQVLLTASDLRRRSGYLHVRNALSQIHALGAIAVINENDSVAVDELMTTFGDNDRLAAAVAGLLPDVLLVILSDVDGLYEGPPEENGNAVVRTVRKIDRHVLAMVRDRHGGLSKGGMSSKLKAALTATSHGHHVVIAPGRDDHVLTRLLAGEPIGTLFLPGGRGLRGRRRWIGSAAEVAGRLVLDAGAARAVGQEHRSLLAIGITAVEGEFPRGAVVALCDAAGTELARGLTNYPSDEMRTIRGLPRERIAEVLGHRPYEVVVHRDNMVVR